MTKSTQSASAPAPSVDSLLAAARATIVKVRYCWAVTLSADGANARPMGHLPDELGEDEWMIWFVTKGNSRKANAIRRDQRTTLVFQQDADEAYVVLSGQAALVEDPSEIRSRWKKRFDVYFPTDADRASAAFVRLAIDRAELWIRGITPEPFGLAPTTLERDATRQWRIVAD